MGLRKLEVSEQMMMQTLFMPMGTRILGIQQKDGVVQFLLGNKDWKGGLASNGDALVVNPRYNVQSVIVSSEGWDEGRDEGGGSG